MEISKDKKVNSGKKVSSVKKVDYHRVSPHEKVFGRNSLFYLWKFPIKKSQGTIKMERLCPHCGRDYKDDPFWTTSLKRHLARKNPCVRDPTIKYIRDIKPEKLISDTHVLVSLEDVVWEPKKPPKGTRNYDIVPWLFRDVFSNESNICFVKPNKIINEILVRVSNSTRQVPLDAFICLFVNHVYLKVHNFLCANNFMFERWLNENLIDGVNAWSGVLPDGKTYVNSFGVRVKNKPEFMIHMRIAVKEFLNMQVNRVHLKNMLLKV